MTMTTFSDSRPIRRLDDSLCICKSCIGAKKGTCEFYKKTIEPIFEAANFCTYEFDTSTPDPLSYKLITILKAYKCDFHFEEENTDENSDAL